MNSKIIIPIAIIITAIVTAGIMYSVNTEPPTNVTSQEPEIIYVEKQNADFFVKRHSDGSSNYGFRT